MVLIDYLKDIMTLTFPLNVLIRQLNSHMMESFAYLTNSECLLCNSHRGPWLAVYDRTPVTPNSAVILTHVRWVHFQHVDRVQHTVMLSD